MCVCACVCNRGHGHGKRQQATQNSVRLLLQAGKVVGCGVVGGVGNKGVKGAHATRQGMPCPMVGWGKGVGAGWWWPWGGGAQVAGIQSGGLGEGVGWQGNCKGVMEQNKTEPRPKANVWCGGRWACTHRRPITTSWVGSPPTVSSHHIKRNGIWNVEQTKGGGMGR